jgi:hypothetical protein
MKKKAGDFYHEYKVMDDKVLELILEGNLFPS